MKPERPNRPGLYFACGYICLVIRSLPAKLGIWGGLFKGVAGSFFRTAGNVCSGARKAPRHAGFQAVCSVADECAGLPARAGMTGVARLQIFFVMACNHFPPDTFILVR
jgi:hypothetical protein